MKKVNIDTKTITRRLDRFSRKAANKWGAFVRRDARSSMRRRKKPSPPGQPPSVHSRNNMASLKNIQFYYDAKNRSVIVGPVKVGDSKTRKRVPAIQEEGGYESVKYAFVFKSKTKGKYVKLNNLPAKARDGRPIIVVKSKSATPRPVTYDKRPFMIPAFKRQTTRLAFRRILNGVKL